MFACQWSCRRFGAEPAAGGFANIHAVKRNHGVHLSCRMSRHSMAVGCSNVHSLISTSLTDSHAPLHPSLTLHLTVPLSFSRAHSLSLSILPYHSFVTDASRSPCHAATGMSLADLSDVRGPRNVTRRVVDASSQSHSLGRPELLPNGYGRGSRSTRIELLFRVITYSGNLDHY